MVQRDETANDECSDCARAWPRPKPDADWRRVRP